MSITIHFSPEEETALTNAAFAAGSSDLADFARQRLLALVPRQAEPQDENEPDDLLFLRTEGRRATLTAQADLLDRGIGFVYTRQRSLFRRHPDGIEEILGNGEETPSPEPH